jgi:probable rRNA maturation factor
MTELEIDNSQSHVRITESRIRKVVRAVLAAEQVAGATLSIALADNATVRRVNREFLQHDYHTDVLSFLFESHCVAMRDTRRITNPRRAYGRHIDGEVLVSAEMALQMAGRFGWSARDELTLYLVHGLLHLCGYDDQTPLERRIMRARERTILAELGIITPRGLKHRRTSAPDGSVL